MTLKQLALLSCFDAVDTNFEHCLSCFQYYICGWNIIDAWPNLLHYNESHDSVPDIEYAYIPQQGVSIVLIPALFLVGFI